MTQLTMGRVPPSSVPERFANDLFWCGTAATYLPSGFEDHAETWLVWAGQKTVGGFRLIPNPINCRLVVDALVINGDDRSPTQAKRIIRMIEAKAVERAKDHGFTRVIFQTANPAVYERMMPERNPKRLRTLLEVEV